MLGGALSYVGWTVAGATPTPPLETTTITLGRPAAKTVTVRLPGKVIGRVDHVVYVRTPRYVFVYRGRRRVIPPKIVPVRFELGAPGSPIVGAVIGGTKTGASAAATVTVPVTVTAPAETKTVTGPTSTVTVPITITGPTTTVTLPIETDYRTNH